jgi:undecaprenyl diphosphate synthase
MKLLKHALSDKEINELNKDGIKLQVIGQKERLSRELQEAVKKAEEKTKNNKEGILNLAISYGGRPEIIEMVQRLIKKGIPAEKINEEVISENLWTDGLADPDFIIRTSGEQRLSGFMPWQAVYAELYFCQKHWPDFSEKDLDEALADYANRQRRFGA